MNRVVITGIGIYSCIGKDLEEVRESLFRGRSGIVLDEERKAFGYRSGLTGALPRPELKGLLDRRARLMMPEQAEYAYISTREALANAGRPAFYSQADIDNTIAGTDPIKYPDTDWQDEIIKKNAPITSHSLSVSGGNNMARFALTANYQYHGGMIPLNSSKKYNVRANTSITLSKTFLINMDMLAIKRNVSYPNRPNGNQGNRILEDILSRSAHHSAQIP